MNGDDGTRVEARPYKPPVGRPWTLGEGLAAEARGEGAVRFVDGVPTWHAGARLIWKAAA